LVLPLNSFQNRLYFCHLLFLVFIFNLFVFVSTYFNQTTTVLKNFFSAKTHPINLSIFRIVVFGYLFLWNLDFVSFFSELPRELMFPPKGLSWISLHIPLNNKITDTLIPIFKLFCFLSMIGLYTKSSSTIAILLGIYLLGIPQLFGKVNHYHHLIWFAILLSTSRCEDGFSVDQLIKKKKRCHPPFRESIIYALPIRFSWVLMGYLYFSSGFWKWWLTGVDFSFSNNLINHIYIKWMDNPEWNPIFKIDRFPWLYQWGGFTVMIFELIFILGHS